MGIDEHGTGDPLQPSTLERARSGDSHAFEELVGPHRRELHVHCYRILGSTHDAEDVLQETLLAAWQSLDGFDGRSLRAWLYRIATNRCRNHVRDATRRPRIATPPEATSTFANAQHSAEPWWLEPYPDSLIEDRTPGPEARYDARESIALSFVAGLQRLPTQQRATLVLRDVLGFSAAEVAELLEVTPASVNSALQRARATLPSSRDPESVALPSAKPAADVVTRFVDAFQGGDLEGVVALLTDDAKVTMPPEPFEFHGRPAIAEFYRTQGIWGRGITVVPTSANRQPAFGYYLADPSAGIHRFGGILVLEVVGDQISAITRFDDRRLLTAFGLPPSLP